MGGSEWSGETSYDSHYQVTGPVFFAATGDTGGVVIYPSCSQYVVAAGGTSVSTSSAGGCCRIRLERRGGGNSAYVPKPSWQAQVAMTGAHRGVPDLASDADPNTGVSVYDSTSYAGMKGWMVFGGTSVATPCLSGMLNASGAAFTTTTAFLTKLYALYGG